MSRVAREIERQPAEQRDDELFQLAERLRQRGWRDEDANDYVRMYQDSQAGELSPAQDARARAYEAQYEVDRDFQLLRQLAEEG